MILIFVWLLEILCGYFRGLIIVIYCLYDMVMSVSLVVRMDKVLSKYCEMFIMKILFSL